MIPPVPKRLLPHSAELVTSYDPDIWGEPSYSDSVWLENVRIEPLSKLITDSSGAIKKLSAVLFFDCRNSSPAVKFALKGDDADGRTVDIQQVIFDGRTFTVQSIETFYADRGKIHHYEVGLA